MSTNPQTDERNAVKPMSLRISNELSEDIETASVETGLSKSDIARLALERGLKILRAQLKGTTPEAAAQTAIAA
ncbi:hypothetical protein GCM10023213_19650 [Prosthecobacter algae]|uniref:Ribbon-helix-helix CopG family protein n=1 Tax=Prosthecobacter algae TaxID=1144682 RepID=A0ABP9P1W2_9BACT